MRAGGREGAEGSRGPTLKKTLIGGGDPVNGDLDVRQHEFFGITEGRLSRVDFDFDTQSVSPGYSFIAHDIRRKLRGEDQRVGSSYRLRFRKLLLDSAEGDPEVA